MGQPGPLLVISILTSPGEGEPRGNSKKTGKNMGKKGGKKINREKFPRLRRNEKTAGVCFQRTARLGTKKEKKKGRHTQKKRRGKKMNGILEEKVGEPPRWRQPQKKVKTSQKN